MYLGQSLLAYACTGVQHYFDASVDYFDSSSSFVLYCMSISTSNTIYIDILLDISHHATRIRTYYSYALV